MKAHQLYSDLMMPFLKELSHKKVQRVGLLLLCKKSQCCLKLLIGCNYNDDTFIKVVNFVNIVPLHHWYNHICSKVYQKVAGKC
jgi:hypothetical protein